MGDPTQISIAPPPTALPQAAPTNVDVLVAVLMDGPEAYVDLQRPVQVNATLISILENGNLALKTAAGNLTLAPQALSQQSLQTLLDQLQTLAGSTKPFTLTIQPGTPAPQIILSLPKAEAQKLLATGLEVQQTEQHPIASTPGSSSFGAGQRLTLTPLPDDIDIKSFLNTTPEALLQSESAKTSLKNPIESLIDRSLSLFQKKIEAQTNLEVTSLKNEALTTLTQQSSGKTTGPLPKQMAADGPLSLQIDRIIPQGSDTHIALEPDQIKATVIGKTVNGQTVIQADNKSFFVHEKGNLPPGTKILASYVEPEESPSYVLPLPQDRDWGSLRTLITGFQQTDPLMAQYFAQTKLPQPQANLAPTLMFFLAALQGGKLDEWLPPALRARLEQDDKMKAYRAFKDDIAEASPFMRDPVVGEWKAFPIPLMNYASFEMLRFYVHNEFERKEQEKENRERAKRTRFLILMNMSRLGAIQMDGLSQLKQLDLIIRSEKPLPEELPDELRDTYIKTLDALGLAGTIQFQSGRQGWVHLENVNAKPSHFET